MVLRVYTSYVRYVAGAQDRYSCVRRFDRKAEVLLAGRRGPAPGCGEAGFQKSDMTPSVSLSFHPAFVGSFTSSARDFDLALGEGFNTAWVITLWCFNIVGREILTLGEGFNTRVITL